MTVRRLHSFDILVVAAYRARRAQIVHTSSCQAPRDETTSVRSQVWQAGRVELDLD
jgi:hypothetical protein